MTVFVLFVWLLFSLQCCASNITFNLNYSKKSRVNFEHKLETLKLCISNMKNRFRSEGKLRSRSRL